MKLSVMTAEQIVENLKALNDELRAKDVNGEIALVGGAVMCLALKARESTYDIDAIFEPKQIIYDCVKIVAEKRNLSDEWLNDSVKGFLSTKAEFVPHMSLSNLTVVVAKPEYLLAMKCLSARMDNANERNDIKFLISYLSLSSYEDVEKIILKYYPAERFLVKTKYAVQEVLYEILNQ